MINMFSVVGWPMWALILLFIAGLVLIVKGGDLFVDAATWMAEVSGIPHFIIGATVVSLATTLPELIVSCLGAARGENAIAIGNAVGSVTANTGLIMAVCLQIYFTDNSNGYIIPVVVRKKFFFNRQYFTYSSFHNCNLREY